MLAKIILMGHNGKPRMWYRRVNENEWRISQYGTRVSQGTMIPGSTAWLVNHAKDLVSRYPKLYSAVILANRRNYYSR